MENQMQEAEGEQRARSGRRAVHYAWAAAGFAAFGLDALGAVLPVLPTTPFLLVAAFCFARSSERLNAWFRSTKLYRTVLEGYVAKRSMTVKAKVTLLIPTTIMLSLSFALMGSIPVGRVVVAVIWVAHVVYFGFVVKTERAGAAHGNGAGAGKGAVLVAAVEAAGVASAAGAGGAVAEPVRKSAAASEALRHAPVAALLRADGEGA